MLDHGVTARCTVHSMHRITVRLKPRPQEYEIKVEPNLLRRVGEEVRLCFGPKVRRAALISNPTVFGLLGKPALRSLRASGFEVSHWLMKDGERHKSLRSFEQGLRFLSQSHLER